MPDTLYFLPHLGSRCTGGWQILPYAPLTLWQCPECRATYPDCNWVREAAFREIRSGEQIQQLAFEGKRLLRHPDGGEWGRRGTQ